MVEVETHFLKLYMLLTNSYLSIVFKIVEICQTMILKLLASRLSERSRAALVNGQSCQLCYFFHLITCWKQVMNSVTR